MQLTVASKICGIRRQGHLQRTQWICGCSAWRLLKVSQLLMHGFLALAHFWVSPGWKSRSAARRAMERKWSLSKPSMNDAFEDNTPSGREGGDPGLWTWVSPGSLAAFPPWGSLISESLNSCTQAKNSLAYEFLAQRRRRISSWKQTRFFLKIYTSEYLYSFKYQNVTEGLW